jgi:Mechanosensitive ion channel, conserved TM helix
MPVAAVHIAESLQQALNGLIGFLPNLIGFLVILVVGYLIAKVVRTIVNKGLEKLHVDDTLHRSDAGRFVERVSPGSRPSHLIGAVAFWFIFLFAVSAAVAALKVPALTAFISQVQNFLPNIIAAVLIFVVAAAIAGAVGALAHKLMGDTPTGRMVRAVGPGLVLAIGAFMVLNQLHIAPAIVTITYAAIMALLVLAGGLAFGLGGRDVAADMLREAYDRGRDNKDDVRRDLQQGRDRAQVKAGQAKGGVPVHDAASVSATPRTSA